MGKIRFNHTKHKLLWNAIISGLSTKNRDIRNIKQRNYRMLGGKKDPHVACFACDAALAMANKSGNFIKCTFCPIVLDCSEYYDSYMDYDAFWWRFLSACDEIDADIYLGEIDRHGANVLEYVSVCKSIRDASFHPENIKKYSVK